ncbi:hypothetical protein VP14_116 [Vibrio phage VPMCC14]|nr:hypothetical protein VP14_116 [Vibrio phage VPMCC14]
MEFTEEDLEFCNVKLFKSHWCRGSTSVIIHDSELSDYRADEGIVELSNGWLSISGAGVGYMPETVLLDPEMEITKDQWKNLGYEDYMLDCLF